MKRILLITILTVASCCFATNEVSVQNNQNHFKFFEKIAKNYRKPRYKDKDLYAKWIVKQLIKENGKQNPFLANAIAKMIAYPGKFVKVSRRNLKGDLYLIKYYKALRLLAKGMDAKAAEILDYYTPYAPVTSFTRFFMLRDFYKAGNNPKNERLSVKILKRLLAQRETKGYESVFVNNIIFNLGQRNLINIAEYLKNKENIEKWLRLVLQAEAEIFRSDSYALEISQAEEKKFMAHISKAEKYLHEAYKLAPERQVVPLSLLSLSTITQKNIAYKIKWFRKAVEISPDNYLAYKNIFLALYHRRKVLSELIKICLKSNDNTPFPNFGLQMLLYCASLRDDYRWQQSFIDPEIKKSLLIWAKNQVDKAGNPNKFQKALTIKILCDIYTLNYSEATKSYFALGTKKFNTQLENLKNQDLRIVFYWNSAEQIIKAFTGPYGKELKNYQLLYLNGKKQEALNKISSLIKSGKLPANKKKFVADLYARISMDLQPYKYLFFGTSPINVAFGNSIATDQIKEYISLGADCTSLVPQNNSTSLILAANQNSYHVLIKPLLKAGVNINAVNKFKATALETAVKNGNFDFAKSLIKLGAKLNTKDLDGVSLISNALISKEYKILDLLLKSGADVNIINKDGTNLLLKAMYNNTKFSVVKNILQYDIELDHKLNCGCNALIWAGYYHSDPKVLQLLIDAGCDIRTENSSKDTVLTDTICGTKENVLEKLKVLIKAGAALDHQNKKGQTALIKAVINNKDINIIKLLVKSGTDTKIRDKTNRRALDWAVLKKKKAIAEYLKTK